MKMETKKILLATLVISLVLLSGLAVLSSGVSAQSATPELRASGSFTVNPTTYAAGATAIAYVSGGTFGSGATVVFYLSTTSDSSGIVGGSIGSVTLTAGATTLHDVVQFTIPGVSPGAYYILATDDGGSTWALGPQVHVVSATPTVDLPWGSTVTVGSTVKVTGSGFDPGATVRLTLNYPGSPTVFGTATVGDSGQFVTYITIPAMSGTVDTSGGSLAPSYYLVAQETNAYSSDYPEGGITAFTSFDVAPTIEVTPFSTQGAAGSTFTIHGNGFVAGQVIPGFSSTDSGTSPITIEGVNTYFSTVNVGSNGAFTVTVTLADDITSTTGGPLTVVITLQSPSATDTFHGALYMSIPGVNPTLVVEDLYYGDHGSPGDPMEVIVSGFPASSSVNVYFDSKVITLTTDTNGFAYTVDAVPTIPALPSGGSYMVFAASKGITAYTYFTIVPYVAFLDSEGNDLDGEYAASGSVITIQAVGLEAYQETDVTDSGGYYSTSLGILYLYGLVSIVDGSYDSVAHKFVATADGVLTLKYTMAYHGATTGTSETLTFTATSDSVGYKQVGAPSVSGLTFSYGPGDTVSLSISHLVPPDAYVTPETGAYMGPFSIYIDNVLITLSTGHTTFDADSSGTASVSFSLPAAVGTGLHTLYLKSHAGTAIFADYEFVVSDPTASAKIVVNAAYSGILGGSGTLNDPFLVYPDTSYDIYGIEFDLYNFPTTANIEVTYYSSDGSYSDTISPDSNGAANYWLEILDAPAGIPYLVSFTATVGSTPVSISGNTWYYEIVPSVSLDQSPFIHNGFAPATDYYNYYGSYANAGSDIDFYVEGFYANTYYNVYLSDSQSFASGTLLATFVTDDYGSKHVTVTLPATLQSGTYYLDVAPASSTSTTTDFYIVVEVQQIAPVYAFPGQFIEVGPISVSPPAGTQYYQVTILLNDTAYKTINVPVSGGTLQFGFRMPNGNPGNYWYIGYTLVPVIQTTNTVTTLTEGKYTFTPSSAWTFTVSAANTPTWVTLTDVDIGTAPTGTVVAITDGYAIPGSDTEILDVKVTDWYVSGEMYVSFSILLQTTSGTTATVNTVGATVQYYLYNTVTTTTYGTATTDHMSYPTFLVQGNGAYIMGISDQQIAQIVAAVSDTIHTSMQVPLAQLNASVEAINDAVAQINTAFGTMYATLDAINATVVAIYNGMATLQTDLGTVKTALTNLNATIEGIAGNVVELKTAVGEIGVKLDQINATLVSLSGDVMTIKTTVGDIQTTVSDINAKIDSISDGIAIIKTDVGNLKTSVSNLDAKITSLQGDVANIQTALGNVQASLDDLNATVTANAKSLDDLKGSVATIHTDLGDIKGMITDVKNGVATIQTDLGTVKTDVSDIKTTTANTSGSVSSTLYWEIGVLVLVIITLVLVAYVIIKVNKIPQSTVKEEVPKEEETE